MTPLTTRELQSKQNEISQKEYEKNLTDILISYHKEHITTNQISITKKIVIQDEIQILDFGNHRR